MKEWMVSVACYWIQRRNAGQPFVEQDPHYGTVSGMMREQCLGNRYRPL